MRPVQAVLAAAGLAFVVVVLWRLHPAVTNPPAPPPADPPVLASDGITASAGFEVAVEPPPERGGSRQDRIEVTSVALYPAHDLKTGAPKGHFIRVHGKTILSRATYDSLNPALAEVARAVPRIPILFFDAMMEGQPLVRGNVSEIGAPEDILWGVASPRPNRPPEPLFYWPGSAQGGDATLTVGLVRGEQYGHPVGSSDARPAFVCSADLKLPADVVARCEVVPVAEIRGTVAKTDGHSAPYETEMRMPYALACSLSGYVPYFKAAGDLRVRRAPAGVRRTETGAPGTKTVSTQSEGPMDSVEIRMERLGVQIVLKVVSGAQAGHVEEATRK